MKSFLKVFILALVLIAVAMQATAAAQQPDLLVTEVNAYHYEGAKTGSAWLNLSNYVDVTVKNNGTAGADAFNVSLYADGEPIGEQRISNLSNGSSETLVFEWKPEGEDPLGWTDTAEGAILTHTGTSRTYTLKAVVDEADEVPESNESNNNLTASEGVFWNGYMADEPLENYAHGKVRGGLIYTTGDGWYHSGEGEAPGTKFGTYYEVNYDLEIPGDTKLARLYFYHTWSKPGYKAPKVGITLKTPSDDVYALNMEKSWLDCSALGGYGTLVWGTYAYDITGYVTESGIYVVNITNLNDGTDTDFAHHYSFAAPAVLVVYENESMPEREYWVNEGADVLMGGYRMGLGLEDCINNASFEGSIDLSRVENATLGVVSPWGSRCVDWNMLYFNDVEIGRGVYNLCGYVGPSDASLDGIRMWCSYGKVQVGMHLADVTDYLNASVNIAGQGDDGDNMMPVNAFLVVGYEEAPPTPFLISGWVNDNADMPVNNPNVTITNLNTAEVFVAETNASSNYYQVLTSSYNVSAGDVLHFRVSNGIAIELDHTVTEEEMDNGVLLQNITIQKGMCGDVTDDGDINMDDVMTLWYDYADYPTPGAYTISNEWAADVTGNDVINMDDVMTLWYDYADYPYPGAYEVNCKPF